MIEEKHKDVAHYCETGIEGIRRTGLKIIEFRDNHVKILMPIEGNINHIGMMYAGSLFTIGEMVGGAIFGAAFDYFKYYPIAKEINIRFRKPAFTDVTLELTFPKEEVERLTGITEEKGKADFIMDLELKDANGEVVSQVHGTWQMRKVPDGFENPMGKKQ